MNLGNFRSKAGPIVQILIVCAAVYLIIHGALAIKDHEKREDFAELMKWTELECEKAGMKTVVLPSYDSFIVACVPRKK